MTTTLERPETMTRVTLEASATAGELADALAWVGQGISSRPAVPILGCVRLTAGADRIALEAFDYEVSARATLDADAVGYGQTLVEFARLRDVVKSAPKSARVTLEGDGFRLRVTAGASSFVLICQDVAAYPELPDESAARVPWLTMSGADLFAGVSSVALAASRDDTLPLLTGVAFHGHTGHVTLTTTDRFRLAEWDTGLPAPSEDGPLIRSRTLTKAAGLLKRAERVTIATTPDGARVPLARIEAPRRMLTTLLVDGDYPPVRRLWPDLSGFHTAATCSARELAPAVAAVGRMAERNTPIRLELGTGGITLAAGCGDDAQASQVVAAELEGDGVALAFNPQYLAEGLKACGGSTIRFDVTHPNKPVLITSPERPDVRWLQVPIRFGS